MSVDCQVEALDTVADHVCVEVTARAGVDLLDRYAGCGDAVSVVRGLLVSLEHAEAQTVEIGQGPLQNRGFAGAGRADQIEHEQLVRCKGGPVAGCQTLILGQQVFFDTNSAGSLVMRMNMVWLRLHAAAIGTQFSRSPFL